MTGCLWGASFRRQLSPDAPPLFCISTSPSTVHEKSGALDASIIEVLVDSRGPDPFSMRLAGLPPGAQLEVRLTPLLP